jgi:hypothetical protein
VPRPHKGDRRQRTIRIPTPLHTTIERAADAAGYDNVNDYIVEVVAMAHAAGLYPKPKVRQESLPGVGAGRRRRPRIIRETVTE